MMAQPSTSVPGGQIVEQPSVEKQPSVRVKIEPHSPQEHKQPHPQDIQPAQAYVPKFGSPWGSVAGSESRPIPNEPPANDPREQFTPSQPRRATEPTSQAHPEQNIMPGLTSEIKQEADETNDITELDTAPELTMSGALPRGDAPPVDHQGDQLVREARPREPTPPPPSGHADQHTQRWGCQNCGQNHEGICRRPPPRCIICKKCHHRRCPCKFCGNQHPKDLPGKCEKCLSCGEFHHERPKCAPVCKTCEKHHFGKCKVCSRCPLGNNGPCRDPPTCTNCGKLHRSKCKMCPVHKICHPDDRLCAPKAPKRAETLPLQQRQPSQQPRREIQPLQRPHPRSGARQTDNEPSTASQDIQALFNNLNAGDMRALADMLNRAGQEQGEEAPTPKRRRYR